MIEWRNVRVRLGDLKPWAQNPRHLTRKQAERLAESFEDFGQVETIAVGPDFEVYNGHQRLSVLLKLHGADHELDARQSSRPLSDDERRRLVVFLHAGAVGGWDWEKVSGWNTSDLMTWGFDIEALRAWNNDATNLREMLNSEGEPLDYLAEWKGMPEHISEEIRDTAICCIVRFREEKDRLEFERLLGYKLSHKGETYSTWFPKQDFDQLGRGTEFVSES